VKRVKRVHKSQHNLNQKMPDRARAQELKAAKAAKGSKGSKKGGSGPAGRKPAWSEPPDNEFRLLHDLPVELVLKIGLLLSGPDVIHLGSTDRQMRSIASDPQLWCSLFSLRKGVTWLRASDALAASLAKDVADSAPDFGHLRNGSFVDALKTVFFAPRSLAESSERKEPKRDLSTNAICRHICGAGDEELAEFGRIFADKVFSLKQDDEEDTFGIRGGPTCQGCPEDTSIEKQIPGFHVDESFYRPCQYALPDLWLCIAPNCGSVRCGRTCQYHALGHFEHEQVKAGVRIESSEAVYVDTGHDTVVKLSTLEHWCYRCERWLGTIDSHPLEMIRVREIGRRILEGKAAASVGRGGSKLESVFAEFERNPRRQEERKWSTLSGKSPEKVYLIGQPFLTMWNAWASIDFFHVAIRA